MKRLFYILLLLLSPIQFNGQSYDFIKFKNEEKIDSIFINSVDLIKTKKFQNYNKAITQIKSFENKIINGDNIENKIAFYYNFACIYFHQRDNKKVDEYLDLGIKIAVKSKKYQYLGKYYELKSINYRRDNYYKYLLISKFYFEKFNPLPERKDLYYNLSIYYYNKKDYDKTIKYALKFKEINKQYFGITDVKMNDFIIIYSLIYTNKLNEAKKILKEVESRDFNNEIVKKKFFLLKMHLYRIKGLIAIKEGKDDLAVKNLIVSDSFNTLDREFKIKEINRNYNFETERNKLDYQLNIAESKLKLQNEEIKYQNRIKLYMIIILSILILLLGLLFKFNVYKTKLNKKLQETNHELKQAILIKNKLLDSISHELRTPLNIIKGIIYLFKTDDKSSLETKKEEVEYIENATNQLIVLTKNIIDYNVIENKRVALEISLFDLKTSIEKIVSFYQKMRQNNNVISIKYNLGVSKFISNDKSRLEQILHCIIDNAIKFTSNGTVDIEINSRTLDEHKEKFFITITDTGIGISEDNKSKIFELFNQGSNEVYLKYGGSGLGLALAQKNIELLNGKLIIQSDVNKGTKVIIEFDSECYDENKNEENTNINKVLDKCNDRLILVVEDNKINQILAKKILNSKGYECEIAENGKIAVDMITKSDYCLVLMDIMMPVMDGFEATKIIKEIKPDLPIVALTAISEELNKDKFQEVKMDKILNKPLKVEELKEILDMYCN